MSATSGWSSHSDTHTSEAKPHVKIEKIGEKAKGALGDEEVEGKKVDEEIAEGNEDLSIAPQRELGPPCATGVGVGEGERGRDSHVT